MGLDNLIRAVPAVAARRPDVLLLIGGQGPERGRLERLIHQSGAGGHVRLVGFIPDAQLAAYYQAADLFVLPTLALEGFGLVTAEALACGLPVLGTDVGATPEILRGLDPRLVIPGTGPDALAGAILRFLGGGWAADLSPGRLHGYVRRHYTWDRHVLRTEALYAQALRAAAPAPSGARVPDRPRSWARQALTTALGLKPPFLG
jgi:glycosyltransferase involved in cell wall biosynthesis